jgi:TolA-binding protein
MALVKVTGTQFVRDTKSMAIMNTDVSEKNEYYNKVKLLKSQKEQINKMNGEIAELKNDIGEIKSLMRQLLDKQ